MKFMEFFSKIGKLRKVKSFRELYLRVGQFMSFPFSTGGFFLQGRMDIDERSLWFNKKFYTEVGGLKLLEPDFRQEILRLEPWDQVRRDMLILLLKQLDMCNVEGAIAELGVYRGDTAALINAYSPNRKLYLLDTFSGFSERSQEEEERATGDLIDAVQFSDTNMSLVADKMRNKSKVNLIQGFFPDTCGQLPDDTEYALVHLDADLYIPTYEALKYFYPRMCRGGYIVVHDYHAWIGAHKAVNDFIEEIGIFCVPMPDKSGSAVILKN